MRRGLRSLFLLLAGLAIVFGLWLLAGPHTARLEFAPAATGRGVDSGVGIHNVVLVSIDTCRADHLHCYGYWRAISPNIDAVASQGVVFEHAVTPVPITLPAHSSMLTGRTPLRHGVRDNNSYRLSESNVTLAEVLGKAGFATGAVIGAFVLDSRFGLSQGFETYEDKIGGEEEQLGVYYNERSAEEVSRLANTWLEEHRRDRFFLFLHYFDPHAPYKRHGLFTLPFQKHIYDGEIAYTDRCVGKVIGKLKDLGLYDSTLLVITADHGEGLGEHGEGTHGFFIYQSTLHVPLIFKVPGVTGGRRIESVAGLIDIVPTICGLLGVERPEGCEGRDLSGLLRGAEPADVEGERFLYCESLMATKFDIGYLLGLVGNRWKYIHSSRPELYDLSKDRCEKRNLYDTKREKVELVQARLRTVLSRRDQEQAASARVVLDDESIRRLESLGYVGGSIAAGNVVFERQGTDPKELVEFYNSIHSVLGYMAAEKYKKARKVCEKMLERWPDMAQIHFRLGQIGLFQDDKEAMLRHFSMFLEMEEAGYDVSDAHCLRPDRATAHTNIGVVLVNQGKIDKAVEHYKKALSYNPYLSKTWHNLGSAYLRQDKFDEALESYLRAVELDKDFVEAHYFAARILHKQGKLDQAIRHYSEVLRLQPDSVEARRGLDMTISQKRSMGSDGTGEVDLTGFDLAERQ